MGWMKWRISLMTKLLWISAWIGYDIFVIQRFVIGMYRGVLHQTDVFKEWLLGFKMSEISGARDLKEISCTNEDLLAKIMRKMRREMHIKNIILISYPNCAVKNLDNYKRKHLKVTPSWDQTPSATTTCGREPTRCQQMPRSWRGVGDG